MKINRTLCLLLTLCAVLTFMPMSALAAGASYGGNHSPWENSFPINEESTNDDEFWEWIKEQGGIVTGEEEYIEINGERVEPDDPFLQWLKEQEWDVVDDNTDNSNNEIFSGALANNQQKRQEWLDTFYFKNPTAFLTVDEYDDFKRLSDSIVTGISDDYQKVYAIHDWVCSHVYYDYPAFLGGGEISLNGIDEIVKYSHMSKYDRLMVYKRGVCGYYSDIFEDLIRAQGLSCITVTGTANGMGGAGPHAWNEVYVNGKWINIDTTFDSNCQYTEGGKYFDGPVSHRYFDISDEDFAIDHKAVKYPGGYVIFKETHAYGELNKGGEIESAINQPAGAVVSVTVKANAGYRLSGLSVSDKYGKDIAVMSVYGSNSQFQFTMPDSEVFVKAEFVLTSDTHVSPNIGSNNNPKIEATNYFRDVSVSDYFFDAVQWAIEQGITSGTSSTTFSPDQTCSKAEIITFIWRAAGSPEPKITSPFSDIAPQDYFYKSALWAYENNMVAGNKFVPYDPCTRAMAVEFLWKQAGCPRVATRANFSDVDARADYVLALGWALEKGITSGTSSTTFSPNQTCNRAQIVTFLYRDMA